MVFANNIKIRDSDIPLITDFLEPLIGQNVDDCHLKATENGFIYLDAWDNKVGFAKEKEDEQCILTLYFKKNTCNFYQVIIRKNHNHWLESQIFDYDSVRNKGIV